MRTVFGIILACAMWATSSYASEDLLAELKEWVFEPCMEVAAALDAGDLDQESRDLGIKRAHVSQLMLASRESAIADLANQMDANATWEDRSAAYPELLKMCVRQFMQ